MATSANARRTQHLMKVRNERRPGPPATTGHNVIIRDEDLTVRIRPHDDPQALVVYIEPVIMLCQSLLDRLVGARDPELSEAVGIYTDLIVSVTEKMHLLAGDSIAPPTSWHKRGKREGMNQQRIDDIRAKTAHALERAIHQVEINARAQKHLDIYDDKGRPAYWMLMAMPRNMRAVVGAMTMLGKCKVWENEHTVDDDTVESMIAEVVEGNAYPTPTDE